ncbi:unnamed protein product, partial [Polarella glacialis]
LDFCSPSSVDEGKPFSPPPAPAALSAAGGSAGRVGFRGHGAIGPCSLALAMLPGAAELKTSDLGGRAPPRAGTPPLRKGSYEAGGASGASGAPQGSGPGNAGAEGWGADGEWWEEEGYHAGYAGYDAGGYYDEYASYPDGEGGAVELFEVDLWSMVFVLDANLEPK